MAKVRKRRRTRSRSRKRTRVRARHNQLMNPKRRRARAHRNPFRRRSRARRNPMPSMTGGVWGMLGWGTVGLVSTRVVGNLAYNTLMPASLQAPYAKVLTKVGVSYGVAWALSRFVHAPFGPVFLGGALDAVEDALASYITPNFPMLAAYPMLGNGLSGYLPVRSMSGYAVEEMDMVP